jgi:prophage tail gpP-like protein
VSADIDKEHVVSIRVDSTVIEHWVDYEIKLDMLEPTDDFKLTLPGASVEIYNLVPPDAEVQIMIDGIVVMSGFVDDREWEDGRSGDSLVISGRDRAGRLVDEGMPLISLVGLTLKDLAERVADIWFEGVTLSNAANRNLLRGSPKDEEDEEEVDPDPSAGIFQATKSNQKVQPGQKRWEVLSHFLKEAGLLAWATADGRQLFVGQPHYEQAPSYSLFLPDSMDSPRAQEGNVLKAKLRDSVGERYSKIVAIGEHRTTDEDGDEEAEIYRAEVLDGPGPDGTGFALRHRKVLVVNDGDIRSQALAQTRAEREQAYRDATGRAVTITVPGHAQQLDRRRDPVLYAPDTIADVELEQLGLRALFLVTSVTFKHSRSEGEVTELRLVPKGSALRI